MLIMTNKNNWQRQNHTKTDAGLRIVTLDDDTIQILKAWKERQSELGKVNFVLVTMVTLCLNQPFQESLSVMPN